MYNLSLWTTHCLIGNPKPEMHINRTIMNLFQTNTYIAPLAEITVLQTEGCLASSTPGSSEGTGEDEW